MIKSISSAPEPIGRAIWMLWPELIELLHQNADKDRILSFYTRVRALPENNPGKNELAQSVEQAIEVKERSELHQQRERGLLALLEQIGRASWRERVCQYV